MATLKQLEVQIMGQSYLLGCPEGGDQRMLEAVEKVDTAMCRIRDAGKVKARDRIAVLAALNIAFESSGPLSQAAAGPAGELALTGNRHFNGNATDANDPRLGQLLQRLDGALGDDGRLI
jgi:cell division protein ZapA